MTEPAGPPTAALLAAALASARDDGGQYGDAHFAAMQALHARGDRETFDAASAWCAAADPVLRVLGADVLAQLGTGSGGVPPFAAASRPVLLPLLVDADARVVAAAVQALAQLGVADIAQLAPLAAHEAAVVRHAVAQALGGRTETEAVAVLVGLMADQDAAVRSWATFAVGGTDTGDPVVAEALAARLDDPHPDARGEAMIGLARRGDTRCAAAIVRELGAADPMPLAVDAAEVFLAARPGHADVAAALDAWRTANRRTLPWLEPPPRR